MQRIVLLVVAALTIASNLPASAEAVIPSGNLLKNPGAEEGHAATVFTESVAPNEWDSQAGGNGPPTSVEYGAAGGFPSKELGASIGGGRHFFAGGLNPAPNAQLSQTIDLRAAVPEIQAGQVQAALTGCLGGADSDDDYAELEILFYGPDASGMAVLKDQFSLVGPDAAARGGVTRFLPNSATGIVPVDTEYVVVIFRSHLVEGTYADGYADNLSFHLETRGSPEREAECSAPGSSPPGAGGGGSGGGGSGGSGGSGNSTASVKAATSRATLRGNRVAVRLECLNPDGCSGSLSLSTARLPRLRASAAAVRLGSKRFSIAAGKTATLKVPISKRASRRFRAIPRRQLRRVRLRLSVRLNGQTQSFPLRLSR
jgi:hypothetical protein